ncbi:MAG: fumarylacetoacetate hydrolase family protein, partial [Saprospiraceae bacterium]
MIPANNPNLSSWVDVSENSDFPIQNLPFGVVSVDGKPRVASAIGDFVIDLLALAKLGYFRGQDDLDLDTLDRSTLNDFIAQGKSKTNAIRERLSRIFQADNDELRDNEEFKEKVLIPMAKAVMLMPVEVKDYTDFYSSRDHAMNVGKMFRDPENALLPNWLHLPVGYHGRASSIVVSGTPIYRPKGQQMPQGATQPVFGASKLLDFELEVGFIVGKE